MPAIIVRVTNSPEQVRKFVAQGFCPVECSIGGESITDDLQMDHHGALSHLESVALRAYRDHYGARREDPRFVIVGQPDADATFAVASLAGILPHPQADVSALPPHLHRGAQKDLTELAALIAKVDTDPIGWDLSEEEGGDVVLTWNALTAGAPQTSLSGEMGVGLWKQLVSGHPAHRPLLAAGLTTEAARREAAAAEDVRQDHAIGFVEASRTWGFDVWYSRLQGTGSANEAKGWLRPVVIARVAATSGITVGCPNEAVAEEMFGPGGLKNVFEALGEVTNAPGWGGREAIGGGPRGVELSIEQLHAAVKLLRDLYAEQRLAR